MSVAGAFAGGPVYPSRSPNLCYGPARSGEGVYCVTALKGEKAGEKLEGKGSHSRDKACCD